jgi:very-short-patch-repair endonuclease
VSAVLQRKKPLTRKKPLRAKMPLRAQKKAAGKDRTTEARTHEVADAAACKLWPLLAARSGPPFVQNERIGPYRADFASLPARLVLLIANDDDPERHDWFVAQNWRVLSFDAATVLAEPDRVLDAVAAAFTLRIVRT